MGGYALSASVLFTVVMLGLGSFSVLVAGLFCTYGFLGLVLPTAMVLALEDHGPIAGTAAALGGTLQMGLGAIAMAVVGAVFNNSPVPLASTIVICALVAVTISFVALKVPVDATTADGVETVD